MKNSVEFFFVWKFPEAWTIHFLRSSWGFLWEILEVAVQNPMSLDQYVCDKNIWSLGFACNKDLSPESHESRPVCLQQEHLKLGFCLQQRFGHTPSSECPSPSLMPMVPVSRIYTRRFPGSLIRGKIEKGAILLSWCIFLEYEFLGLE
jgi:hypothetical protein